MTNTAIDRVVGRGGRAMKPHEERAIGALQSPDVLDQALDLDPALFAALAIAGATEPARFPLSSPKDLEDVLEILIGDAGRFRSRAVDFSTQQALEHFPAGFFPVADRGDLLKKAYLTILGAHTAAERVKLEAFRADPGDFKASHPVPDAEV